ncbi:MAG: BlaI/MecI/CopY family transcriptional regulator [Ruminococcus sp.]|uniref:BlaI/MecI/CopY family transcriptional regulator n=1 Tax=Ruminococcus sp. TaxID=41978 RepID=UPI0028732F0D|nr:BlaI/MecI/CopY family transcriptional regulator [Ruminococcus sp.]MBQ3284583.1 BlaI/MecI/CopY family transcriptional regulator [Ruminococcus sp.]MBQ3331739.1 BlaI/MecI/CopY family transcriptional regulator [Ruminococcus sp.]
MLTKSEKQIMDLLWSVNEPLSCTEIVEMSGEKTWKDSYVHSLIKSLMKKDMVEIAAFELISRSYARKFMPKLNKEQYCLREYLAESPENSFLKLFTAYAENYDDAEEMKQIEAVIKQWKKSHNA